MAPQLTRPDQPRFQRRPPASNRSNVLASPTHLPQVPPTPALPPNRPDQPTQPDTCYPDQPSPSHPLPRQPSASRDFTRPLPTLDRQLRESSQHLTLPRRRPSPLSSRDRFCLCVIRAKPLKADHEADLVMASGCRCPLQWTSPTSASTPVDERDLLQPSHAAMLVRYSTASSTARRPSTSSSVGDCVCLVFNIFVCPKISSACHAGGSR